MKKIIACILSIMILVVAAGTFEKNVFANDYSENLKKAAQKFTENFVGKNYEEAFKMLSPELQKCFIGDSFNKIVDKVYNSGGNFIGNEKAPVNITVERNIVYDAVTLTYAIKSLNISLDSVVKFNKNGLIDDFSFLPNVPKGNFKIPAYNNKAKYTEKEVVVGNGKYKLPGKLTIPKGNGNFPAVVLVHGSGPSDMDETVGGVKPFRDLAYGLASNGIAVLRFEKVTKTYTTRVSFDTSYTLKKETVDSALDGINLLKSTKGIDKNRVFVLGHSQGAMAAPLIINDYKGKIAGAVMMAGPADFFKILLEQNQYLASIGSVPPTQVEFIKQQINIMKQPDFPNTKEISNFKLGAPEWWLSVKNANQVEIAKKQTTPLLILQGKRDFQVSASSLEDWKKALNCRKNISYKLYPKLNHIFTEGKGEMSTMEEYNNVANIPNYVVSDIVSFIKSHK